MKRIKALSFLACTLVFSVFTLVSCEKEGINDNLNENTQNVVDDTNWGTKNTRSCPDNLTYNSCNFTSGDGRDYPNQFTMVNLLDNCHRESLPNGCSWTSTYETKTIYVHLDNCCKSAAQLNANIDSWMQKAKDERPAGGFLIVDYERTGGLMESTFGPYRMYVKVTYRKKSGYAIR